MSRTARTQTEWSNRWQILVFTCCGGDSYDCDDGDDVDGDDDLMIAIREVLIKSDVHHQLLPWSDEQIRWAPLITLMVGCKKKRGGISIEIFATSLSKKISTPTLRRKIFG